jgi:hypothetical protein
MRYGNFPETRARSKIANILVDLENLSIKCTINTVLAVYISIRGSIQKLPDWPPGARTANDTALCHYVQ